MNIGANDWIDPAYREGGKRFRDLQRSPRLFRNGVGLDRFLREPKADELFQAVEYEAKFEDQYKLYGEPHFVDEKRFRQAPEEERMLHFLRVVGARRGCELSPCFLAYRGFWEFCHRLLPAYLSSLIGAPLALESQVTHSHAAGHFIKSHNDAGMKRKLCAIFYLSRGWQDGDGGSLMMGMEEGGEQEIHCVFNRVVLFIPSRTTQHHVTPHSPEAATKNRISHVAWFRGP
ncbi:2OG-Fe(II) oxygenase [Endothiovibrio diazotrophicus]